MAHILLDAPYSPGDFDPGNAYEAVQITRFSWNIEGQIEIVCMRGNIDGAGKFKAGVGRPEKHLIWDNERSGASEYTGLISILTASPGGAESYFQGVGRELYTYLMSKGLYSGTLIP